LKKNNVFNGRTTKKITGRWTLFGSLPVSFWMIAGFEPSSRLVRLWRIEANADIPLETGHTNTSLKRFIPRQY
jgi:hypothetical protein